jgi:hypothetical protein
MHTRGPGYIPSTFLVGGVTPYKGCARDVLCHGLTLQIGFAIDYNHVMHSLKGSAYEASRTQTVILETLLFSSLFSLVFS